MNLQQRLTMAQYIAGSMGTKFEWGNSDCNTFVADMVDRVFDRNTADRIRGKYSNLPGAVKFSKQYMTAAQWLYLQGYRVVDPLEKEKVAVGDLIEGDIVAVDLGRYTHASVFHNSCLHTIDETVGYTATRAGEIYTLDYTVWRHN